MYHYALGVLSDPLDAEEVTKATFANAYRSVCLEGMKPQLNALLGIAHEVCRQRAGHSKIKDAQLRGDKIATPALTCSGAELAISRHLDGRFSWGERRLLRAHLRGCEDCESFARCQDVQRAALRSITSIPVPQELLAYGPWKQ